MTPWAQADVHTCLFHCHPACELRVLPSNHLSPPPPVPSSLSLQTVLYPALPCPRSTQLAPSSVPYCKWSA